MSSKASEISFTLSPTFLKSNDDSFFKAVLLCFWDNIVGPHIRNLWTNHQFNVLSNELDLKFVATHTLSGEVLREATNSSVESKLFIDEEKDIVVSSFIFGAVVSSEQVNHSLSFVLPYKNLEVFKKFYQLTLDWMPGIIYKLRLYLEVNKLDDALSKFNEDLFMFMEMFQSLRTFGLPPVIKIEDTYFNAQKCFDEKFIKQAILSHLMTCGHSVVIGTSVEQINTVINTLALFSEPDERVCSRYVTKELNLPYHHDLYIQAIFKDLQKNSSTNLSSLCNIFKSKYPTTLVDLINLQVKHSSLSHKHLRKHQLAVTRELESIWHGLSTQTPSGNIFWSLNDSENMISELFLELKDADFDDDVANMLIEMFKQSLNRLTISLILLVKEEKKEGKYMISDGLKKLKNELDLKASGDIKIVLACAEKLYPGIYSYFFQDPKSRAN